MNSLKLPELGKESKKVVSQARGQRWISQRSGKVESVLVVVSFLLLLGPGSKYTSS